MGAGRGRQSVLYAQFLVHTETDGTQTLVVSGTLGAASNAEFGQRLDTLVADSHTYGLVDLAHVTSFHVGAVVELLAARTRALRGNRTLVLVNPSEACLTVLETTGLDLLFEIRD